MIKWILVFCFSQCLIAGPLYPLGEGVTIMEIRRNDKQVFIPVEETSYFHFCNSRGYQSTVGVEFAKCMQRCAGGKSTKYKSFWTKNAHRFPREQYNAKP